MWVWMWGRRRLSPSERQGLTGYHKVHLSSPTSQSQDDTEGNMKVYALESPGVMYMKETDPRTTEIFCVHIS
jgi:hypothetical protein